jgi:hypothetical protein
MLVQVVLCLTVLMGVMAVALDGGIMQAERRHAQATADAAALAGAVDLFNSSGSASTSATTTANANGYTSSNSTITVRVNPANYLGGPHAGTQIPSGYIEVTVTYNQARFFSSIWGSSSIPISARAVARGQFGPGSPAILVLAPTGSGTLSTNGGGDISVTRAVGTTSGGNIIVDSNSSSGITAVGSNAIVTDPSDGIYVSGPSPGYSGGGLVSPAPIVNQPSTPDPLRFIPEPSQPSAAPAATTANGVTTYYPGYYANDPKLTGSYGTVVFQPGLYYMAAGLTINGNSNTSLTGNGVTFFIASGTLKMGGSGNLTLSPPTSGTYQGVMVFQSRSDTNQVAISGGSSVATNVQGTLYAPAATISIQGNGGSIGSQIIANQVSAGGTGVISVKYDQSLVGRARVINLVE